ncbi:hypothetical protein OS493_029759 [Desmophyllum pertusum]|uniref:Uncharacterized protein n=1 Tax=Desmophyllum pertusum TaxID=174260 RepID=A0A9X0CPD6_9CNID|nr:hypothetical protein OS493_029759 [Desmophyllum pertusum]
MEQRKLRKDIKNEGHTAKPKKPNEHQWSGLTIEYHRSKDIAVTVKTDTLLRAYTKYWEKTKRQNNSPATPVRTGKESPSMTSVGVARMQIPVNMSVMAKLNKNVL